MLYRFYVYDDEVFLVYEDYRLLRVRLTDFNRCFGAIFSASYDDVLRDFAY